MTRSDWWQDFFVGGPWSKIQSGGYAPERTSTECDLIQRALQIAPGARVLDIPCGIGRHSVELARRGFLMTGVDFVEEFIGQARTAASDARVTAEFLTGDMREFTTDEPFDAAFCFFGSFGYFSESDDERFARAVAKSLRAGGRFAVDAHLVETLLPLFKERDWFWGGEPGASAQVVEERRWDLDQGRIQGSWTVVDAAGVHRSKSSIRIYSYREMTELFRRAGFATVNILDGTGAELRVGARRALVVAQTAG
jgi:SAM-dependent methyltransferase